MTLYIYLAVLLNCLAVGLFYRKALPRKLQFLVALIAVTVVVEAIGTYYLEVLHTRSTIFRIYQPIEYTLLALYFINILTAKVLKRLIEASIVVAVALNIFYIFKADAYRMLGTYTFLLSAFLFTLWSILYFSQLFKQKEIENPAHNPDFWICAGILFFYAGTFFQMGFTNMIYTHNPELAKKLYIINHLLNCILYGMMTYGFICQSKYRKLLS